MRWILLALLSIPIYLNDIPDIEEAVQFIALKLAENERGALTRLMRVKEIIRK